MGRIIKLDENTYIANDLYDTSERIIGIYKNKTLYRKIIEVNSLSSGLNNIPHGITNFDKIINISGTTNNANYIIGAWESTTNFIVFQYVDSTYVRINLGSGWAGAFSNGCSISIEYTKTV